MAARAPIVTAVFLAILPQAAATQVDSTFAAVQDTVSNPIVMACGERIDPVGYVVYMRNELELTTEQVAALVRLDVAVRQRNLPLAAAWRADRTMLAELRDSYRRAVADIEAILTPEQWAEAQRPPARATGERRDMVRCLLRSHLAMVR